MNPNALKLQSASVRRNVRRSPYQRMKDTVEATVAHAVELGKADGRSMGRLVKLALAACHARRIRGMRNATRVRRVATRAIRAALA